MVSKEVEALAFSPSRGAKCPTFHSFPDFMPMYAKRSRVPRTAARVFPTPTGMPLAMRKCIAECRLRRGAPERSEDSEVNFGGAHTVRGAARVFAVLVVLAVGGCSFATYERAGGEPFLLYSLTLADAHLKVVHVRGTVFGASPKRVVLRSIGDATGKRCEPIALRGDRSRRCEDFPCAPATGSGSSRTGGAISPSSTTSFSRSRTAISADVRDMMTFVGVDRCRILGRDVFLVPELPVADGILVDVAMVPGWRLCRLVAARSKQGHRARLAELPFTLAVSGDYRNLARDVAGSEIAARDRRYVVVRGRGVLRRRVQDRLGGDRALRLVSPVAVPLRLRRNPVRGGDRFDYYGIHYGGSMILLLDRRLDRSELMDTPMAIIAHEFFHNWNGEALGPAGDEFLWFTEGVTNLLLVPGARDGRT